MTDSIKQPCRSAPYHNFLQHMPTLLWPAWVTGAHAGCRADRAARKLSQALGSALAHEAEAEVAERVLVEEVPDEALRHGGHGCCPAATHVRDGGCLRHVQHHLHMAMPKDALHCDGVVDALLAQLLP